MISGFCNEPPQFEIPHTYPESINLIPRSFNPLVQTLSEEELKEVRDAAYRAFEKSGLKDKGIEILNITDETKDAAIEEIKRIAETEIANKNIIQKIRLCIEGVITKILNPVGPKKIVYNYADCMSAGYAPVIKRILINMDSVPDFLFHEMGHALTDKYGNFFSKSIVKSKFHILSLAPVFLLTSLIKSPKKNKEEKPKEVVDKITTFIKNNCGKLVAASFIPVLIDEGLASIKGQKSAKQEINSKKILEGLKNTHLKAYSTYLLVPVLFGGISALLVRWRDNSAKKQPDKQLNQY